MIATSVIKLPAFRTVSLAGTTAATSLKGNSKTERTLPAMRSYILSFRVLAILAKTLYRELIA